MRVGFVVAPEEVAAKMVVAKQSEDVHTNQFFQMLCYKFMTECDLDAHISMIREVYGRKCRLMLDCLEKELPSSVKFTRPEGGLFIWVTLPDGVDAAAFLKACIAEKLKKFSFCLSKPQAWHIISPCGAGYHHGNAVYLITRQRVSSCGLMICNASH